MGLYDEKTVKFLYSHCLHAGLLLKQLVLWNLEKVHLKMILRRKRKKMRMTNSWILMLGVMKRFRLFFTLALIHDFITLQYIFLTSHF